MDEELKAMLEAAHSQGASDNDLKKLIDLYEADKAQQSSGGANMGFTKGSQEPQEQSTTTISEEVSKPSKTDGKTPYDIRTASVQLEGEEAPSTVLMSSGEVDGKFVAFPTLFPKDPNNQTSDPKDWIQPEGWAAYDEAVKRGEVWEFDTEEEAAKFAEGAWKKKPSETIFKVSEEPIDLPSPTEEEEEAGVTVKPKVEKKGTTLQSLIQQEVEKIPEEERVSLKELEEADKLLQQNVNELKAQGLVPQVSEAEQNLLDRGYSVKKVDEAIAKRFPTLADDKSFTTAIKEQGVNNIEFLERIADPYGITDEQALEISANHLINRSNTLAKEIQDAAERGEEINYGSPRISDNSKTVLEYMNTVEKYDNLMNQNKPLIDKIEEKRKEVERLTKGEDTTPSIALLSVSKMIPGAFAQDFSSRLLNSLENVSADFLMSPASLASLMEETSDWLSGEEDKYTIVDKILDFSEREFKSPLTVSERQFYKDGNIDFPAALLQTADQVGTFAALAAGNYASNLRAANTLRTTRGLEAARKGIDLVQKQQNISTVVGGYVASLESNRREAKEMGLSGAELVAYTNFMSFLEGATELIMPDNKILSPDVKDIALKTFIGNLSKGKRFATREAVKGIGEAIGKENLEELLVLAGKTLQTSALALENEDIDVYIPELEEVINTVASTSVLSGGGGVIGAIGTRSKLQNQAILKGSENIEMTKNIVQQYVNKGVVSEKDANAFLRNVEKAQVAKSEIPTTFTDSDAADVLTEAEQLVNLREEAKTKQGVAKEQINEEIKRLEDVIRKKAEERKAEPTPTEEVQPQVDTEVSDYIEQKATDIRVEDKVGTTLEKVNNAETVNDTEIESAIDSILEEIDRVEQSDYSEDAKKKITEKLFNIAEQLDNYEFRAKTETVTTTERRPIRVPIETPTKKIAAERFFANQPAEVNGEVVELSTEGGVVQADTKDGNVIIDTPTLQLKEEGVELDENGAFKSATFVDRFGTEVKFVGDTGLDLAIKHRENTIGTVPEAMFETLWEEYTTEKQIETPYIKSKQDAVQERETTEVPMDEEAQVSPEMDEGVREQAPQKEEGTKEEKVKPTTVESETKGLTQKETFKQGFEEYVQALKDKNKAKTEAAVNRITDRLNKAKDKAAALKDLRQSLKEYIQENVPRGYKSFSKSLLKAAATVSTPKQAEKIINKIATEVQDVRLKNQKAKTKNRLKIAARRARGKTTLSQLIKQLSKVNLSNINDLDLLVALEKAGVELQKDTPTMTVADINNLIDRVTKATKEQEEIKPLKDRIKDNTYKRLSAKTPQAELSAEIERQALIVEYLNSQEDVDTELLRELDEELPIDFKSKTITSLDVAKKANGDIRRATDSINKAFNDGIISEQKRDALLENLDKVVSEYQKEVETAKNEEKAKFNNAKKTSAIPINQAEREAVKQFLDAEPVDNLAWYTKANEILESLALGIIPYKAMSDLKSYSAYKSKVAEEIGKDLEGKEMEGSVQDIAAQLGKKDASQRERNILGIRTNKIWLNIYQPMVAAVKKAEKLTDTLLKDYVDIVSAPRFFGASKYREDMSKIGMIMHYLQEQGMEGLGVKADGVNVGTRDIFGIYLGIEEAMDAAGMDAETKKRFLKGQALSYYSNREQKLMKKIHDELKDPKTGIVDVTKLDPKKILSKEQYQIFLAARDVFDKSQPYQEAANLSRGVDFDFRVNYFPTKRKGGTTNNVEKPVNIFTKISNLASAGKEKKTYSLSPENGVFGFMLNEVVLDHASEVSLDYVFSLQQPAMNALLTSTVNQSNRSKVAMAIKNDYNQSLVWQATLNASNGIDRFFQRLLGARYAKSLYDPIRSVVEATSAILGASVKTGSFKAITNVFDKNSWKLLNQLEKDFGIEIADFKDVELNRRSIREGLSQELAYVKLGRYVMTSPEYISAISLFLPTLRRSFKSQTGLEFDLNSYLNDTKYRELYKDEIKEAVQLGQQFVERVQGSKVKAGTRRSVEYLPTGLKSLIPSNVSSNFGLVDADSKVGRLLGFFGNYTYREQGELFTSLKFILQDIGKGKVPTSEEIRNASGVLTTAMTYTYLMNMYYIGRQLLFGDDDEKEEAMADLENMYTPVGILKSIVTQVGFLGLSKYGKAARASAIGTLSSIYSYTEDKDVKELIEYVLKEQFYIYKPLDVTNKYSISVYTAQEFMPAVSYLTEIASDTEKSMKEFKEDPEAMVGLSLATNLTNLFLMTTAGTQLPMTPVIKKALEKDKPKRKLAF